MGWILADVESPQLLLEFANQFRRYAGCARPHGKQRYAVTSDTASRAARGGDSGNFIRVRIGHWFMVYQIESNGVAEATPMTRSLVSGCVQRRKTGTEPVLPAT